MTSVQKEFLSLISNYQGIIHKVNLIYFKSDTDKQDNFQEIIYQLWRSYSSLKNKENPASWIYSVAINTSISKIRKDSKLIFTDSITDMIDAGQSEKNGENTDYQDLLEVLQKMNEIDRSIMLLYMEDYNYDEIAEIIGISSSNVGVKIHRLKNQLKQLLKI